MLCTRFFSNSFIVFLKIFSLAWNMSRNKFKKFCTLAPIDLQNWKQIIMFCASIVLYRAPVLSNSPSFLQKIVNLKLLCSGIQLILQNFDQSQRVLNSFRLLLSFLFSVGEFYLETTEGLYLPLFEGGGVTNLLLINLI